MMVLVWRAERRQLRLCMASALLLWKPEQPHHVVRGSRPIRPQISYFVI